MATDKTRGREEKTAVGSVTADHPGKGIQSGRMDKESESSGKLRGLISSKWPRKKQNLQGTYLIWRARRGMADVEVTQAKGCRV